MSYYLVTLDNKVYANDELYYTAISGGERAFMKELASKKVVGTRLLDQMLFPVEERRLVSAVKDEYHPIVQDFDDFSKHLNVLSKKTLEKLQDTGHYSISYWPGSRRATAKNDVLPGATLIRIPPNLAPELFEFRKVKFFKVRDYKEARKYKMLEKMASVRVCGCIYVAINAVDIRIEEPILVTLTE